MKILKTIIITVPFSRSVVQNIFRPFDGFFFYVVKVGPFREILPDQPVQVLVGAPFPTMVGPGKVKVDPQALGDLFVVGELLAVIAGHGAYERYPVLQQFLGPYLYVLGPLALHMGHFEHSRHPVVYGEQRAPVALSDDQVDLQVPEPLLFVHYLGPLAYTGPVGDMAPSGLLVPPLAVFFAARPQVQVELPALLFVPPYELVYPLGRYARVPFHVGTSLDLFGARVLFQPIGDKVPYPGREGLALFLPRVPGTRLPLRQFGPIPPVAPVRVPFELPGDRRPVPSQCPGDLGPGAALSVQDRNFVPFPQRSMCHVVQVLQPK